MELHLFECPSFLFAESSPVLLPPNQCQLTLFSCSWNPTYLLGEAQINIEFFTIRLMTKPEIAPFSACVPEPWCQTESQEKCSQFAWYAKRGIHKTKAHPSSLNVLIKVFISPDHTFPERGSTSRGCPAWEPLDPLFVLLYICVSGRFCEEIKQFGPLGGLAARRYADLWMSTAPSTIKEWKGGMEGLEWQ